MTLTKNDSSAADASLPAAAHRSHSHFDILRMKLSGYGGHDESPGNRSVMGGDDENGHHIGGTCFSDTLSPRGAIEAPEVVITDPFHMIAVPNHQGEEIAATTDMRFLESIKPAADILAVKGTSPSLNFFLFSIFYFSRC